MSLSFNKVIVPVDFSGESAAAIRAGLDVVDDATLQKADLIVIPSHGFHGMKRLVLGSVAERVIRHASCSVLVQRRSDAE